MFASVIDSIGNTPLVKIQAINPEPNVTILAKLEYMNPGGSIKDRAALYMINQAEADGELTPEKTVIEATSGNTGIGLALICAVKGYKLALAMSESASEERKKILKARGAEIILTPRHLGSDGAIEEAYRLAREYPDKYFLPDQYNNSANWKAHYHTTGPEIMAQTEGNVDAVVATVGTSGTLMGLCRYFKDRKHHAKVICAEPYLGHGIQGLKNMKESYTPEIFDKTLLDESVHIEDEAAFETARLLAKKEGLFVGMSSGAAMAVAMDQARRLKNGVIVVIFPDSGERYLSTSLFSVKKDINLNVYNSLSQKKEAFIPKGDKDVGIYTCGPTVHRRLDIGHFRRHAFTDLLIRSLEYQAVKVNHVVNITDYDDKTIDGARAAGTTPQAFTRPFIDAFQSDLKRLGMRPAQAYAKVSEHFTEMTDLARTLLANGHAYEKLHSVYFDLASVRDYGQLSRVDVNKIRIGATVDLDEYEKQNPRDFTLLKRVKLSELKQGVGIKTEWGNVRPSLHLQCAAIATALLGAQFDIHTGSRELMFPHHENEIAIAKAAGGSFARVWMHCAPVHYDGSLDAESQGGVAPDKLAQDKLAQDELTQDKLAQDKLAQDKLTQGELTLDELTLDRLVAMGWDEKVIRFWLLSAHYRKTLILSKKSLDDAGTVLGRINRCIASLDAADGTSLEADIQQLTYDIRADLMSAMADDLKVPVLVSGLLSCVKRINRLIGEGRLGPKGAQQLRTCFKDVDQILNVFNFSKKKELTAQVASLIAARDTARQNKDFKTADAIRKQLDKMGIPVHDHKV